VGVGLSALALWATTRELWRPINVYDEGLLLTNANLLLHGGVPYRDFYSNYPPGAPLLFAGLWTLCGVSPLAPRVLGLLAHVAIAVLVGHLAARISGRRFVWIAAGLTLGWLRALFTLPYAWLLALATALAFVAFLGRAWDRRSRAGWLLAGATLGLVSTFRHDLFAYFALALGLVGALLAVFRRGGLDRRARPLAGSFAVGLALVLLAFWLPILALAGVQQVAADLYFDQVRYVMPARVLPMVPLFELTMDTALPFRTPAFLTRLEAGGIVLAFAGVGLAGLVLLFHSRLPPDRLPIAAAVSALALAVLPQMLGRTDMIHAIFTVSPALILLCALLDRLAGRRGSATALPLFAAVAVLLAPPWPTLWPPRLPLRPTPDPAKALARGAPLPDRQVEPRRKVLAFIHRTTRPGDPIFVGLQDHRRILSNEVDLYYLADRPGATRYLQFDPNVVTRAKVQKEMIEELERRRPAVAILVDRRYIREENLSNRMGARLLDRYLRSRYAAVERAGPYLMLLRKDDRERRAGRGPR